MIDKNKITSKFKVKKKEEPPKTEPKEVKFSCGHSRPIEVVTKKQCPACREKETQEELKKSKEARKKKHEKQALIGWKRAANESLGRLPNGAQFTTIFHTDVCLWNGILTIPTQSGMAEVTFMAEDAALFRLMAKLDRQFREYVYKLMKEKNGELSPTEFGSPSINPQEDKD